MSKKDIRLKFDAHFYQELDPKICEDFKGRIEVWQKPKSLYPVTGTDVVYLTINLYKVSQRVYGSFRYRVGFKGKI